ncbi:MAG: hypothetical protein M3253_09190, partial [Chloroflexota bacterium]|nr:hypothetical protein [Chloroflexota bacterium]
MSPEQCQGLPLDGRSDLYSLGVVLYEATTRYLPFEIHTPTDAVYKHVFTPPPPPRSVCPDLPDTVEAIILRCLAKSPEQRYRDATELAAALQAALAEIEPPVLAGVTRLDLPVGTVTVVTPHRPAVGNRIAVTLPERTLTITPGQPATFPVTIANLGRTVDHFTITVEGVPPKWVQVPPQPVQLNPNANTTVRLTINVPRAPSARAGEHDVTIIATSQDTPAETGKASARWTVLPFAALALDIEPVQAGGPKGAAYSLTLANEGNAEDTYTLRGSDDERALTYTFRGDAAMDYEDIVRIGGGTVARVALQVGASRRWLGKTQLRSFQVRATSEETATGQTVTARFAHRPVVPAWALSVAVLLVIVLSALLPVLLRPTITDVAFDPPAIVPGQAVTVRITAPRARGISFVGIARPEPVGPDTFTFPQGLPPDMKELTVRATNLFGSAEERFPVGMEAPPPIADARIERFAVDRPEAATGDTVTVSWEVSQADTIELQPFGTVDAAGTQRFTILTAGPAKETYTLVATNRAGRQVRRSIEVAVRAPTGPVLPAVIEEFAVEPSKARKGDTVTIRWRVSNAKAATLKPGGAVPLQGQRTVEVQNHGPTQLSFELIALSLDGQEVTQSATVAVLPAPAVVVIEQFTAEPQVAIEGQPVTVTWRVRNAEVVEVSPFGRVDPAGRRPLRAKGPGEMAFELKASTSGQPDQTARAVVQIRPAPPIRCQDAVQGKIAWNYSGSTTWAPNNVERLCRGASDDQPARCFQRVMHGGINWGGGTRWEWQNAIDLCEGTADANATI